MYDLVTYFDCSEFSPMMTRKSIDTVRLSVAAEDPPPVMVASAILEHRNDTAALCRLQEAGN